MNNYNSVVDHQSLHHISIGSNSKNKTGKNAIKGINVNSIQLHEEITEGGPPEPAPTGKRLIPPGAQADNPYAKPPKEETFRTISLHDEVKNS